MENMKETNDKKLESLESKLIEVTAQIISLKNEGNKVREISQYILLLLLLSGWLERIYSPLCDEKIITYILLFFSKDKQVKDQIKRDIL